MRIWQVVPVADGFLRHVRFGRDGAESTTKSYACSIALFLRWCARTGPDMAGGRGAARVVHDVAGARAARQRAGARWPGMVLAGPGGAPARGARRINAVLTAVRGMAVHAVADGRGRRAPGAAAV